LSRFEDTLEDAGTTRSFEYFTSFHWTIAQITLGAIDISPVNSVERVFTIVLLVLGMLFNATIVSLISSQTMEWVTRRAEKDEMLSTFVRFLDQHRVDKPLQQQVRRQLLERLSKRSTMLSERDVAGLNVIAAALRSEVLFVIRRPHIIKHTLFRVWNDAQSISIKRLCEHATRALATKPQDIIFVPGSQCGETYFPMHGSLRYSQDPDTSHVNQDTSKSVPQDTWISEAALWCHWTHVGKLEAETSCQLMTISSTGMFQAASKLAEVGQITRTYGREYHLRVVAAKPPHSQWPTDLYIPFTSASDLMSEKFSLELLRRESEKGTLAMEPEALQALRKEVQEDKCSIQTGRFGELERVVFVLAVRLKREVDNCLWTQVGSVSHGSIKPDCTFPGRKRKRAELIDEAYQLLLEEWMAPFASCIMAMEVEETTEVKDSSTFHMPTRYMRVVQHALLMAEFDEPPLQLASHPPEAKIALQERHAGNRVMQTLLEREVYALSFNGQTRLFAWLDEDTFSWLTSTLGAFDLEEWLRPLEVTEVSDVKSFVADDQRSEAAKVTNMSMKNVDSAQSDVDQPDPEGCQLDPEEESRQPTPQSSKLRVSMAETVVSWGKGTKRKAVKKQLSRLRRVATGSSSPDRDAVSASTTSGTDGDAFQTGNTEPQKSSKSERKESTDFQIPCSTPLKASNQEAQGEECSPSRRERLSSLTMSTAARDDPPLVVDNGSTATGINSIEEDTSVAGVRRTRIYADL